MRESRFILGLLLATAMATSLSSKPHGCTQPVVPASVLDARGLPVRGLQLSDFEVETNGRPAKILSVTEDHSPRRVVVVLDASQAMRDTSNGKWTLALQIAIDAFVKMPQETQMALIIYSKKIEKKVTFNAGRPAALMLLGNLRSGTEGLGPTGHGVHFRDTVLEGISLFGEHQFGDAILAIGSGYDTGSRASVADVERGLAQTGTRIFLSVLVSSPTPLSGIGVFREALPATVRPPPGQRPLPVPAWVRSSGGDLLTVHSAVHGLFPSYEYDEDQKKNLAASLAALYQQILEIYRFEVDLPAPPEKSARWTLRLSKSLAASHKDWLILSTANLVSCSSGNS